MTNERWCAVAVLALLVGCATEPEKKPAPARPNAPTPDLDAEIATTKKPLVVLVFESGKSAADDAARALLEGAELRERLAAFNFIELDLLTSRNRATAARFHVTETPLLFCMSRRGVILSRDEKTITLELVRGRLDSAEKSVEEVDAKLTTLDNAVAANKRDAKARLELATFLRAQGNAREAIPYLESVAHADDVELATRVTGWHDLARAHLWIAEPEKGRHEAQALIDTLGPKTPDAIAAGHLVLGVQDASGKRYASARRELEQAVSAASDSVYAQQAREELAKLPPGH